METSTKKTVLITGSSTGIGRATAIYFHEQGWNVAATMRSPQKETEITRLPDVICPVLDVTDEKSIHAAIDATIQKFGAIDVIVNNAGYGLVGTVEGATEEQIKRQFDVNVFGMVRVMKAILPYFRKRQTGLIINITSLGGRIVFPYHSFYHGTKWAIEGISESMKFEIEPLGIRIKLVEPGAVKTDFYDRSIDLTDKDSPSEYKELYDRGMAGMHAAGANGADPKDVATVIFQAASDKSNQLRYSVGITPKSLLFLRRIMPDSFFAAMVKFAVFK